MTHLPVMVRWLADNRRALIGWSVGMAAVVLVYLPLYPSLSGNGSLEARVDALPPDLAESLGMTDMADGAGYAQSTVFGLLGMLLVVSAAIAAGSRAVAGDEERGSLELTLAHAVSRHRLVVERAAAITVMVSLVSAVAALATLGVNDPADLRLTVAGILGISLALGALAMVHGAVALVLGAAFGRRALAFGGAAAIAALGYLADTLGPQLSWGSTVESLSPFNWAFGAEPLRTGVDLWGLALLALSIAVLLASAAALLNRRDIGV